MGLMREVAAACVQGLQMHGLPHRPGFDVVALEKVEQRIAAGLGALSISVLQHEGRQPAGGLVAVGLGHPAQTGHGRERVAILREHLAAALYPLLKHPQLTATDARQHIAQAVVVAVFNVLVMPRRLARLGGELAGVFDQRGVVAHQHAAARGGDDFVAVERKHRQLAEAAAGAVAVGRAERFGRVFEHGHAIAFEQGGDLVHLGALAVKVDDHGGLGRDAFCLQRRQRNGQSLRRQIPALRLGVDEYWRGAELLDGVGAGHEGQAGTQHHIARPHAQQAQAQM